MDWAYFSGVISTHYKKGIRTAIIKFGTCYKLFKEINRQLEVHYIIIKTGAILGASALDKLRKKLKDRIHQNLTTF